MMRGDSKLASWLPTIFCSFGGLLGVAGAFCVGAFLLPTKPLPELIGQQLCSTLAGVGMGGFAGGFIGLQLELRKLRPYLRQAIEDYASETTRRL